MTQPDLVNNVKEHQPMEENTATADATPGNASEQAGPDESARGPAPVNVVGDGAASSVSESKVTIPDGASPPPERVSQVHLSLDLAEGMRVRITVEGLPATGDDGTAQHVRTVFESLPGEGDPGLFSVVIPVYAPNGAAALPRPIRSTAAERLRAAWKAWPYSLEATLFSLALLAYLVTRLVGLDRFPIYFFTDEAVQTVLASDLLKNDFKNYAGDFLPAFFENGGKYRLGTSVYLQVLPTLLFGKSVFVTRAASVLVGMTAALAVGLILRNFFKKSYWWSGAMLLSITPTWFLHSRTAFEYPIAVAFYALFLYFYLQYRCKDPRYLYLSLVSGALAFYSYSPFQMIVVVSGALLLLLDLGYHWKNRATGLRALVLLVALALPYVRFITTHGRENYESLVALGSYWIQPVPLAEKMRLYFTEYLRGLNPGYWFNPNTGELERHLMKGYGHLSRLTLPFILLGLILAFKNFRSPAHRAVLVALLAAPSGAALVQIGPTRALAIVIPAALLAALGLAQVLQWIQKRRFSYASLSVGLFAVLALANFTMLRDALVNGPTWYGNYSMGGMQYGASQVFKAVQEILKTQPGTHIVFSPNWANGADTVARFFLSDPLPIQIGSIEGYIIDKQPLDDKTLFVMTPEEFERTTTSGKFTNLRVERTLPYPDGRAGFYFVRLSYVDQIDQLLAADREARRRLQEADILLGDQPVHVRHSMLDMGEIANLFDGNPETLARTFEADPLVVELTFSEPRLLSGLTVKFGSTEMRVKARLFASQGAEPVEVSGSITGTIQQPAGSLTFDQPVNAQTVYLEIDDLHQSEPGHVHIWEISLQ